MTRFQTWIATLNLTAYKGVWTVWLWATTAVATYVVMVVSAWRGTDIGPMAVQAYASWLFGLAAFSGITTAEFYGKRTTDTRYQVAKNAGPPSPTVEVKEGGRADVSVAAPTPAPTPAPASGSALAVVTTSPAGSGREPDMYHDDERGD